MSLRSVARNVGFGRHTQRVNFHSNSVLLHTSRGPLRHFKISVLHSVTRTHAIAMLHSKGRTRMCVPRVDLLSVTGSSPVFIATLIPGIISSIVPNNNLSGTNVRGKSDLITIGNRELGS